ncbi:hypothetical protein BJV74DRAFT_796348 [Russula compacta]|nr:hypothetical protein BJV74DRAFT_796348 [Russula compacta]
MAHFFPAASRLDVERAPSLNRRTHSRNASREAGNDSPSDSRPSRPSHINWMQSSLAPAQAGPSMPRRPPSARLSRSASLSALPPAVLHRQSSLISNHSLQLDKTAGSRTDNPASASAQTASAHPQVKQLSPISEQSYVPTPRREQFTDVEPSTPVSISSSHSAAFLRRPLKRSISATSTSSLRNSAASSHPPILPPLNLSPLDLRPGCPPLSHPTGQQLISTVFEDAGSERTPSFVTARSVSVEGEDAEDTVESPDAHGPSNSTILASSTMQPGSRPDLLTDPDRATEGTTLTATPPDSSSSGLIGSGSDPGSGGGSGSGSSAGAVPAVRPRPRRRVPTSGGSGSTSDTFIWRRWTRGLSFGSSLSRPSFSAARRALASRLPPLPILLFWGGFLAPWCWLIGGWLIAEGRWEDSGKARAALPLRKPKPHGTTAASKGKGKAKAKGRRGGPQLPSDSLGKDLEKGDAAAAAAPREDAGEGARARGEGGEGGEEEAGPSPGRPRQHWAAAVRWIPFASSSSRHGAAAALGPFPDGEKVVTLVKPYSAEVWVYRCRQAAVSSAVDFFMSPRKTAVWYSMGIEIAMDTDIFICEVIEPSPLRWYIREATAAGFEDVYKSKTRKRSFDPVLLQKHVLVIGNQRSWFGTITRLVPHGSISNVRLSSATVTRCMVTGMYDLRSDHSVGAVAAFLARFGKVVIADDLNGKDVHRLENIMSFGRRSTRHV